MDKAEHRSAHTTPPAHTRFQVGWQTSKNHKTGSPVGDRSTSPIRVAIIIEMGRISWLFQRLWAIQREHAGPLLAAAEKRNMRTVSSDSQSVTDWFTVHLGLISVSNPISSPWCVYSATLMWYDDRENKAERHFHRGFAQNETGPWIKHEVTREQNMMIHTLFSVFINIIYPVCFLAQLPVSVSTLKLHNHPNLLARLYIYFNWLSL